MKMVDQNSENYEPNPKLVSDLSQLLHDRANRFEQRPMSLARLQQTAAQVPPVYRRVEYLLAAAAVIVTVGAAVGLLAVTGGGSMTTPAEQVAVVDNESDLVDSDGDAQVGSNRDSDGEVNLGGSDEIGGPALTEGTMTTSENVSEAETSDLGGNVESDMDPAEPDDEDLDSNSVSTTRNRRTSATTTRNAASTTRTDPSRSSTTAKGTTTTTPTTTTANEPPSGGQLERPNLGRLVPSKGLHSLQLSVTWDAVPGATGYKKIYTMEGSEIGRPGSASETVAKLDYSGTLGRQYCLDVVATSPSRPDSEPSRVCSADMEPVFVHMGPGFSDSGRTLNFGWIGGSPFSAFEIRLSPTGEVIHSTAQKSYSLDLEGLYGRLICPHITAIDSRGTPVYSATECIQIPSPPEPEVEPVLPAALVTAHTRFINDFYLTSCSETDEERVAMIRSRLAGEFETDVFIAPNHGCPLPTFNGATATTEILSFTKIGEASTHSITPPWAPNCQWIYWLENGSWVVGDRYCTAA